MVAKRISPAMQARNARARALGYENYYQRRVAEGRTRGLSRNVALGQPGPREVGVRIQDRMLDALPGARSIQALVRNPKAPPAQRRYEVTVIDERGRSQVFRFDVRAKDAVKRLLGEQRDLPVPVSGTP